MLGRRKIRCTPGAVADGNSCHWRERVRCPLAKYGILHCFFFSCGPIVARLLAYWILLVATTRLVY